MTDNNDDNAIFQLRAYYLQTVPADKIPFRSLVPETVNWEFQDRLYKTVLIKDATEYPPATSYTRRFLKLLLESLERNLAEDDEIHDSILSLYSACLSTPSSVTDVTKPTYVTYTIPPNLLASKEEGRIIISERKSLLSADGHTGSRTWEAALALGEYFLSSRASSLAKPISQSRIIELGAGTGFASILLSKLDAKFILATDGDESVCESIKTNINLNKCQDNNINVSPLLWGRNESYDRIYEDQWDLIIGGDITYDSRDLESLVYTLQQLLEANSGRNATALISATIRNEHTTKEFERLLSPLLNWSVQRLTAEDRRLWYYGSDTPIQLYTITAR